MAGDGSDEVDVFVTRRLPDPGIDPLEEAGLRVRLHDADGPPTRDELLASVAGCRGVLCLLSERIDGELLDAAGPALRVVANLAVGYDNIDIPAAAERGIVVTNTPD